MNITLQQVLDLAQCYLRAQVEFLWAEHAGDRESIRPSEFVGVVPDDDAMWVLSRLAPERTAREAACAWAERALRLAGIEDSRSWHAVEVARRYARGEASKGELSAAEADSWAAVGCAAWGGAAAYAAAYAAADWDAFWDVAHHAAYAAAAAHATPVFGAAYRGMLLDLVKRMEASC